MYTAREAEVIVKEMMDQLSLDMASKKIATDMISLYIGYCRTEGIPGSGGTANVSCETNTSTLFLPAIEVLYRRIVCPSHKIRRISITCCNVIPDPGALQLSVFEDTSKQPKAGRSRKPCWESGPNMEIMQFSKE